MTWTKEVSLILIKFLHDPELIIYLLSIAKPINNRYIFEEAKLFHESLRMTREKRWARTKELSKQRKFHQMNNLVPITCTLPFNNIEWRASRELIKSIHYIRKGFLRRKYLVSDNHCEDVDLEIPLKVKCINHIFTEEIQSFGSILNYFGFREIQEALSDLEIYQDIDDSTGEETPYNELPYLLIEIWYEGTRQSGYSKRNYAYSDNIELYIQEIMN